MRLQIVMTLQPDRIKQRRRALQLSQEQLAELTGVNQPQISRWELKTVLRALGIGRERHYGRDPDGLGQSAWHDVGLVARPFRRGGRSCTSSR